MRRCPAFICAVLLALAASAGPAAAEGPSHPLLDTIKVGPPTAEHLKDPCGVAVDAKGDVYVSNYYQHAIYVFDKGSGGKYKYLTQFADVDPLDPFGKEPLDGPCDLAFDAAGNLYVNNWHRDVVKLSPSPPGSTNYTVDAVLDENHSTSVAVDPSTNRIYVDDRAPGGDGSYVAVYEASGAAVISGGAPLQIGLGSLGDGYGVAISHFGLAPLEVRVDVADAADETVKVYDPSNPLVPVGVITGAATPQGAFHLADADLAVDPSNGHLYVTDDLQPGFDQSELAVDEFSALGHYRGRLPYASTEDSPTGVVHGRMSAITVANEEIFVTSGDEFVIGGQYAEGEVLVFGPAPPALTQVLTVEKAGAGSGTVARVPSGWLQCGAACEGEFDKGASVELAATPAPHSRFAGWTGCKPGSKQSTCSLRMDADAVVGAEFEPIPQQRLAVAKTGSGSGTVISSPPGVECGSTCEGEFDEAAPITLTANAAPGTQVAAWTGCDSEPTPSTCTVTLGATRSVSVELESIPSPPSPSPSRAARHTLSVISTGTGAATGAVNSEPAGIDCGGVCAHVYDDGTAVTLVAHPAPHSSFLGWGGCDGASGARCTVTLGADKTVVAAFAPGYPGRLRLRGLNVRGAAATLEVGVPAAGSLAAVGRGLRPAATLPLAAGPTALRLHLNNSAMRALGKVKSGRFPIKVALSFVPFDGGETVRATKTVVFGQPGGRG